MFMIIVFIESITLWISPPLYMGVQNDCPGVKFAEILLKYADLLN